MRTLNTAGNSLGKSNRRLIDMLPYHGLQDVEIPTVSLDAGKTLFEAWANQSEGLNRAITRAAAEQARFGAEGGRLVRVLDGHNRAARRAKRYRRAARCLRGMR